MLAVTLAAELGADAVGDFPAGAPILVDAVHRRRRARGPDRRWRRWCRARIVLGLGDITSPGRRRCPSGSSARWCGCAGPASRRTSSWPCSASARRSPASCTTSIAHSVSVMLVGVRGARDVLRTQPDVAEETLAKVEASGEQSLAELRRVLGAAARVRRSRRHAARSPRSRSSTSCSPRRACRRTSRSSATARPLPKGVELSAYRIIQEALTNVRKHAHATMVIVRLTYGETLTHRGLRRRPRGRRRRRPRAARHARAGRRCTAASIVTESRDGPRVPSASRPFRPDDPDPDRRRPGPDPHRVPALPRHRRGAGGRGGGGGRSARRCGWPASSRPTSS